MKYHQHFYKKDCVTPEGLNKNSIDKREGRNYVLNHLLNLLILLLQGGGRDKERIWCAIIIPSTGSYLERCFQVQFRTICSFIPISLRVVSRV